MSNQVLGLFDPRLNYPASQPAGVDQLLAGGGTSQPLTPQGGGGGAAAPAAPQVEGLFDGGGMRGAAAGIGAGGQVGPSYDTTSAMVNVGTATLSGAVSGGLAGGPAGAVAGGILGLATSGINAWMQVSAENKRKAQTDSLIREINSKQNAKDEVARQDAKEQLAYDRKQAAFQKAWGIASAERDNITRLINQNTTLRSNYIKTGIRSQYA